MDQKVEGLKVQTDQYTDVEYFWKIIEVKQNENIKAVSPEELEILKNNKIIELDKDRWLIHMDNLFYFLNIEKRFLLLPGKFDILKYDKRLNELIGQEPSYRVILDIFYILDIQTKKENEVNKLDNIIIKLKNGEYCNIDESKYWFLYVYPYIKCVSFCCRDESMTEKNKSFRPNYGGRCIELLSDKKIIIDGIPIESSDVKDEMKRLKEGNLAKVMIANGIPANPSFPYDDDKKDTAQKDIMSSWGS